MVITASRDWKKDGTTTVLADSYEGKRLNSPNDLVYRSDGALYFTDPPFGLPKFFDDSRKELPYSGVFSAAQRQAATDRERLDRAQRHRLLARRELSVRHQLGRKEEGDHAIRSTRTRQLGPSELFFDMTAAPGEDALDGMKVDVRGNLYVSGPGGLWIISAEGKHSGQS